MFSSGATKIGGGGARSGSPLRRHPGARRPAENRSIHSVANPHADIVPHQTVTQNVPVASSSYATSRRYFRCRKPFARFVRNRRCRGGLRLSPENQPRPARHNMAPVYAGSAAIRGSAGLAAPSRDNAVDALSVYLRIDVFASRDPVPGSRHMAAFAGTPVIAAA